eukprot:gene9937-2119_t
MADAHVPRPPRGSRSTSQNAGKEKPVICYYDEYGNDVTPRSLVEPQRRKTIEDVRQEKAGFFETLATSQNVSWGSRMMSSEGSVASSLPYFLHISSGSHSSMSSGDTRGNDSDFEDHEMAAQASENVSSDSETEPDTTLTDAELNEMVYIRLNETDTIWLLDIPPTWVPDEDEDVIEAFQAENDAYEALLHRKETVPDTFVDRFSQTDVFLDKDQEVQTDPKTTAVVECQASSADMYDTMNALSLLQSKVKGTGPFAQLAANVISRNKGGVIAKEDPMKLIATKTAYLGFGLSEEICETSSAWNEHDKDSEAQWENAQCSIHVKRGLQLLERILAHDTYAPQQCLVKGSNVFGIGEDVTERIPLRRAWSYNCEHTKNACVLACAWNKSNPDILAVAYGFSRKPTTEQEGMICCWSIKQPEYPHRIYRTLSTAMCLDFSSEHPEMLAVGLACGTVAVYDIKSESENPLLDTWHNSTSNKHTHPVWDIQFISMIDKQGADEQQEMLVSAASDGQVLRWYLRKGLEANPLVKVKRVASDSKAHHGNSKTAFIARQAGVMSMAFSPSDASMYFVGTEDGNIHKCSTSYSDTFLDSYFAHTSSVYRLSFSPLNGTRMLSCSADWSLHLWDVSTGSIVQTLRSGSSAVRDASWSHHHKDVLASICDDYVYLWDLSDLEQDPVFSCQPAKGIKLSCIKFNPDREYLVIGDCSGTVHVYTIHIARKRSSKEDAPEVDTSLSSGSDSVTANITTEKLGTISTTENTDCIHSDKIAGVLEDVDANQQERSVVV